MGFSDSKIFKMSLFGSCVVEVFDGFKEQEDQSRLAANAE